MKKDKLLFVLMKHKLLSILLTVLVGLGYSVECSAQQTGYFKSPLRSGMYVTIMNDTLHLETDATKKIAWTVGTFDSYASSISYDGKYITNGEHNFVLGDSKTALYFVDTETNQLVNTLVNDKSYYILYKSGTDLYLIRNYKNTSGYYGYFELKKFDSTSNINYNGDYAANSSTMDADFKVKIASNRFNNCAFVFEKAELPSVKYGKIALGSFEDASGTASIEDVTLNTAFNSGTECIGAATKELTLTASAKEGYTFKGWKLNGELIEGSATSPFIYTYSYSSESTDPTADVLTPVFKEVGKLTECYITYAGNSGTYYISMASASSLQRASDKQIWTFGDADENGMISLSTEYNNNNYYLTRKSGSGSSSFAPTTEETSLYFFDASNGKLVSELTLGNSYFIVAKSSSSYYVMRYSSSSGLTALEATTSSSSYKLSDKNFNSSTTLTISSSYKSSCTFSLAAPPKPSIKYGKVSLAASVSNGTYSITSGTTDGALITSTACIGAASKDIVLAAEASTNYVFMGWSVNGGTTILEGSNVSSYTYSFSFDSEDNATPTEVTLTPVFEKLPELSGTKCFLMNGDNYIGYASGAFTLSTTNKQEWAFGTTSDFVTPFSTLVNNQINYLGYKYTSDTDALSLLADDNNTIYFFDTATNKAATSLEVGKSYYIVVSSTSGTSNKSKYLIRVSGSKLVASKQSSSSKSNDFTLSSLNISELVTIDVHSSVKTASTFTLASTNPAVSSAKYGKVSLAASVSNGTYSITSGTTDGALITSTACIGAASKDIVLAAEASTNYVFKGWSVDGGTTILEGSNVSPYTYSFSFDSEDNATPTEVTLTPVFKEIIKAQYYIQYGENYVVTNISSLDKATKPQVWNIEEDGAFQFQTTSGEKTYNLGVIGTTIGLTESDSYVVSLFEANSASSTTWTKASSIETSKYYLIVLKSGTDNYILYRSSREPYNLSSKKVNTDSTEPYLNGSTITLASSGTNSPFPNNAYFQFAQVQSPSVKYGKVTLATVENGTYSITDGTTSGELITSDAVAGAASKDIVLTAEASTKYVFMGWSVNGGTTILEGSNVSPYTYSFSFDSEDNATPTEVILTPVFEKLPELSGTKCFLMNGDNYIGYADGAFTSSTTDKQEWAFGTTSDFVTPFSTLVNNQINYLGYPASLSGSTQVFADVNSSDNNSVYFFDATTNKPASSLEAGKSYFIVLKSTNQGSTSRYVVSYSDGTLKTTKASTSSGSYIISNTTISADVTLTLENSVKAACTFTLASTAPATPSVKYGKVTLATVENGTYSITDGTTSGDLITSDEVAGAASKDIVLEATANKGYEFMGWSVNGGTTILEGSNVSPYTYSFSFDSEDNATPTEVTLTPVFEKLPELSGTKCFLMNGDNYIGYADGAFTSSTTDKQEWAFGTTSDFVTPFSTLVNNQINYLGYPASVSGSTKVFADVNSSDNSSVYFFDATTNKPASSLEAGKSYYIVIKSTRSESDSRYVVSYSDGTLKTTKANDKDDNYQLSNTTITSDVTITLDNSVKAACTFTLASTTPEPQPTTATYYGKLTVSGSNGTIFASTEDEAIGGDSYVDVNETVDLPAENATKTIYLYATPDENYDFLGWSTSTSENDTIEGSKVAKFAYTFEFDGTELQPTDTTLYAIFKMQEQPQPQTKTLYGKLTVSGSNGTVYIATESGAVDGETTVTVSDDNVASDANSATKTLYLYASANEGYDFLGWSTSESEDNLIASSNVVEFAYSFTFSSETENPEATTLFALFKRQEQPNPGELLPRTDISVFDNVLYLNDEEITTGTQFDIELNMKNADENIRAFQCDIYLPEGIDWTTMKNSRQEVILTLPKFNEERTDEYYHNVQVSKIPEKDNCYRIIVYSDKNYTILKQDGAILSIPLTVAENMKGGGYNILLKDIIMTTVKTEQESTVIEQDSIGCIVSMLTVNDYTIGDVNNDHSINVTDIVAIVSYLMGQNPQPFIIKAADAFSDGSINVTDIVKIIDIINSAPAKVAEAKAFGARKSVVESDNALEVVAEGNAVTLNMTNKDEITAFQCDVYLSEGIEWASALNRSGNISYELPTFAGRTDVNSHSISLTRLEDGGFRIIVYSINNDAFAGNEGAVLNLPLNFNNSGSYSISLENITLTTTDVKGMAANNSKTIVNADATGMNGIMNAGKADGKIFDLNGIRSNKAKHGFNIINNKKMWIE